MLVTVCSAKGSPGVTSLALALCAAWPREPVTLLEADPTGADLAFRCRHGSGREVAAAPNTVGLATAVRGVDLTPLHPGRRNPPIDPATDPAVDPALDGVASRVWEEHSQPLACGVRLVPGAAGPAQTRGLRTLWPRVAAAAAGTPGDVVADLGRVQSSDATVALVEASSAVVVVCQPTLESVSHARGLIVDLASAHSSAQAHTQASASPAGPAGPPGAGRSRLFWPVVVGPRRNAQADAADIDTILGALGIAVARTMPVAFDPRALAELQAGANPRGRLGRAPLMTSAATLAATLSTTLPTALNTASRTTLGPGSTASSSSRAAAESSGSVRAAGAAGSAGSSATWELRRR